MTHEIEFTMDLPDLTDNEIQLIIWGLQRLEDSHPDAVVLVTQIREMRDHAKQDFEEEMA